MVKRILVALSGTPYTESAVHHALDIAKRHGSELTGVTIADPSAISNVGPVPLGGGAAAHELAEFREQVSETEIEKAIEMFDRACRDAGTICCIDREEGDPFDQMRSLWRYHDLTVIGIRGIFEYGVVRNPDDYLLRIVRDGVRPILAVSQTYRPVKRILIAYDGSNAAAMAMKRVLQPNFWPDPEVRIVVFEDTKEEPQVLLNDARRYCLAHGIDPEVDHAGSTSGGDVVEYATGWGADLIVLGAKTRSRVARYVLGDSTLQAIHEAEVPLFMSR